MTVWMNENAPISDLGNGGDAEAAATSTVRLTKALKKNMVVLRPRNTDSAVAIKGLEIGTTGLYGTTVEIYKTTAAGHEEGSVECTGPLRGEFWWEDEVAVGERYDMYVYDDAGRAARLRLGRVASIEVLPD